MCRLRLQELRLSGLLRELFRGPEYVRTEPSLPIVQLTICPAPITPKLFTSRAPSIDVELKHLEDVLDRSACLVTFEANISYGCRI
jgi:hypothetical protein